eukprot:10803959-Karenia_brevis.AAC.1
MRHIKSHSGHPWNELADSICVAAREGRLNRSCLRLPSGAMDRGPNGFHWRFLQVPSVAASNQYWDGLFTAAPLEHGYE